MGYKIQYEPELDHKYYIPKAKSLNRMWFIWGCTVLGVLIMGMIPTVRGWLWEFMIPGDARITTTAFRDMITDMREGMNLTDAVTVFCQEILANG